MIKHLTTTSKTPHKGTNGSIGFDLFADTTGIVIPPGESRLIPTGIAAVAPNGSYLRIAPRSGLTVKQHINTLAGVIDPDYRGNIGVVLYNFGKVTQHIQMEDKIAQMIPELASSPDIKSVSELLSTSRNFDGFGSTDNTWKKSCVHQFFDVPTSRLDETPAAAAAVSLHFDHKVFPDLHLAFDMPYDIDLSDSPFEFFYDREINISGAHPTLGLILEQCDQFSLPCIKSCLKSTPAAKLPRWRSELKHAYILSVNGEKTETIEKVETAISSARKRNDKSLFINFGSFKEISHHSQLGIPQLFHDQLNVIAQHLWDLDNDPAFASSRSSTILGLDPLHDTHLSKDDHKKLYDLHTLVSHSVDSLSLSKRKSKLTRRKLIKCSDWDDWESSEFKQLDQYFEQGTFGEPEPLPEGCHVLNLLWTYLIKDDGRKKARCVCNGSKKMRGTVTLAETYASSLEQTGARIFWAATALNNFITIGADAANAFAEAPPPVAPLYVLIGEPFRNWYKTRFPDKPTIPPGYVLKVNGALQGHPESPRLWENLIDGIIKELDLQPCTHEPNLYYCCNYKGTHKTVLFLRQTDDFAISAEDSDTARDVFTSINGKMKINVKELGLLNRFNGVDVTQTRDYIKLSNSTYLKKVLFITSG